MAQAIYKMYLGKQTAAWYQLSKEEQDGLLAKAHEINKTLGVKNLVRCNSRWANEEWSIWGVDEFADLDMLLKQVDQANEINWHSYFEFMTVLGTSHG